MGSLTPGVTYIYERANGVYYAREAGADPSTRKPVGFDFDYDPRTSDGRPLHEHLKDDQLWGAIRRAAKTDPVLQKALDQCIIIYHLSKDKHGNSGTET
jgi:hypothetical protein